MQSARSDQGERNQTDAWDLLGGGVVLALLVPTALVQFVRDRCIQWAAALAYYTLIGLVPLLIALFSVIKWCGLHRGLTPFIMTTIGAGSPDVASQIVRFIDHTNVNAVGILSTMGAGLAVLGILGNAELCLNTLWGSVPGRSWLHKIRAFFGVAVAAPLMVLLALAGTTFLRRDLAVRAFFEHWYLGGVVMFLLRLIPYALVWISFTMLYTILPNRPVRLRSAVIGAVIAGFLWQLAQWGYVTFVIKLVQYSAVYGALWQLPILLAWIYVGWLIMLFGAEVCRIHQQDAEAQRHVSVRLTTKTGHGA